MAQSIKEVVAEQIGIVPECCRGGKKCKDYICYTLRSVRAPARTYSGSTNHFVHRIRQHNGLIKGGAHATHTDQPWKICSLVHGFSSKASALRYEYFTKVKHSKTYDITFAQGKNSIERRAALLLTAELKMRPEERRRLKYFVPDRYMAECLERARGEGVPGTVEAAWSYHTPFHFPPKSDKLCYVQENAADEEEEASSAEEEDSVEEVLDEEVLHQGQDRVCHGRVQARETPFRIQEGEESDKAQSGDSDSPQ